MDDILPINSVQDYTDYLGVKALHPLATLVNFDDAHPVPKCRKRMGVYAIVLKDTRTCGAVQYGLSTYDYREGTLMCVAPGQVIGAVDDGSLVKVKGYSLIFHPDFIRGTPTATAIRGCSFFSYASNEALHMAEHERDAVIACFHAFRDELSRGIDRHTHLIASAHIDVLLGHCSRFYDRQFVTREPTNRDVLRRFEDLLQDWLTSDRTQTEGLPTVAACAKALSLSPNYFGDLVRRETQSTAQDYIHHALVDQAKIRLSKPGATIAETAYSLGFKYPHHLSRLFRSVEGISPSSYRQKA